MPMEIKMWQARDGQTFPTEVEALRHELQKEVETILEHFLDERYVDLNSAQGYFCTRGEELKKVIQYFQFLAGNVPHPTELEGPKRVISEKHLLPGSYKGHLEKVASGEVVLVIDPD